MKVSLCYYRGTSRIRNTLLLEDPTVGLSRDPWWSWGKGLFLMSEVSLSDLEFSHTQLVVVEVRYFSVRCFSQRMIDFEVYDFAHCVDK